MNDYTWYNFPRARYKVTWETGGTALVDKVEWLQPAYSLGKKSSVVTEYQAGQDVEAFWIFWRRQSHSQSLVSIEIN